MKTRQLNHDRRRWLAGTAGALALGAGAGMIPVYSRAQSGGFRALVCVFLYGGNDGLNMTPPVGSDAYRRYQSVRGPLSVAASGIEDLDGNIGLHGAMRDLLPFWQNGQMAVVNNVGVLSRPTSQEEFFAWKGSSDNTLIPDNLFSHSDQQILWETASSSVMTRAGWGGRLMELLGNTSPVYGFGKASRFGEGEYSQALSLPGAGSELGLQGYSNDNRWANARLDALQQLVAQGSGNQLQTGFSHAQFSAFETSALLGDILAQAPAAGSPDVSNPAISEAFEHFGGNLDNALTRQLYQVAKMIRHRAAIGGNRHLYFVTLDDFDHHANQMVRHQELLGILGPALASFQRALQVMGVTDQVTTFTQSDFGRTFKPNSSGGTDHGWGNQQLVLGGGVDGGRSHGLYPSLELGGPDDSGEKSWEQQGRWIPGVAMDQYLGGLVNWFASDPQGVTATVLPNLARFDNRALAVMRGA